MFLFLQRLINKKPTKKQKIEAVYKKWRFFMYRVAYDVLKNHAMAEDAVQETILRLIDNIDKIDDIASRRTRNYIGVICRHIAYDMKYRKVSIGSDAEYDSLASEALSRDALSVVIDNENVERIKEYIKSLNYIYQEVLFLYAGEGMSVGEIAQLLGISTKTVQKRLERARIKIRQKLAEEATDNE